VSPGGLTLGLERGREISVGRSVDVDMVIPDPRVSRKHATVRWDGGRVSVIDLSANGTSIDGARFESGEVVDGDVLRFGDSFVILRFTEDPDEGDADVEQINGIGPAMRAVRRKVAEAASTAGPVRIGGPPGVGKRAMARVIHERSGRPGELVFVDAQAGEELAAGIVEAGEGTVYLANVETLQDRDRNILSAPHGSRIIVGTRVTFDAGDLFDHEITILPLRKRREDILPYVQRITERPLVDFDPELVAGLLRHLWPYNVRELSKVGRALAARGRGQPKLSLALIQDGLAFIGGAADQTLPATELRLDNDE
jgi:pSer/pThr/pTyr-binding forkhead associated (FHA) protein